MVWPENHPEKLIRHIKLCKNSNESFSSERWYISEYLPGLIRHLQVEHLKNVSELFAINENMNNLKAKLCKFSRTDSLQFQYFHYIKVVGYFIRAERRGNRNLHLVALSQMINVFSATGHINYEKSSRSYKKILELPDLFPWVYTHFITNRQNTVRRVTSFGVVYGQT